MRLSLGETFRSLRNFRPGQPSAIRKLSDDSVALAQILLLFRVVLADGVIAGPELAGFQKICEREFSVATHELPALHALLESPTGLMAETQMFLLLRRLDGLARSRLLGMMTELAESGPNDSSRAARLIALTSQLLEEASWTNGDEMTEAGFGGIVGQLRDLISQKSSVEKLADDPALMAEVLLLVRMSFADHSVKPAEADAFRKICSTALGLDDSEVGDIVRFVDDSGYETTNAQAAEMLAGLSEDRRRKIMDHMATIARSDGDVSDEERKLFHDTARRLGLD